MAIVALTRSTEDYEFVAIAHHDKDARTDFADAARERGIAGFNADVLADNHGKQRVQYCAAIPSKADRDMAPANRGLRSRAGEGHIAN